MRRSVSLKARARRCGRMLVAMTVRSGLRQKAAVAAASGARTTRRPSWLGSSEVPTISEAHRKRIELGRRYNMVREEPIFGDPSRPARRVEADQPHEATW
jgi:hypothetical protein